MRNRETTPARVITKGVVAWAVALLGLLPGLGTAEETGKVSQYDAMPQVLVPAGDFTMGADDEDALGRRWEFPPHRVRLSAYWIDQHEVTNAQFAAFLNTGTANSLSAVYSYVDLGNPFCRLTYDAANKRCVAKAGYERHPVCAVSGAGAAAYALSVRRRLPTEAEWEKAARGTDQRRYPWGNTWDPKKLVTRESGAAEALPVGSRPGDRSPYGALDMAGNVSEWAADTWEEDYYLTSPTEDPANLVPGPQRVVRGGAWCLTEWDARATSRRFLNPGAQRRYMGFRCAETVPAPLPEPTPVSAEVLFYAPMDGQVYAAAAKGERRPLKVLGDPGYVAGHRGQAVVFGDEGGVQRCAQYDAAGNFRPEEGTLSLWIQLRGWQGTDDGYRYFFMIMDEATCKLYLYRYGKDNLIVIAGNGIETQWESMGYPTAAWRDGQWLHLAVTWKERRFALYIDGKASGQMLVPPEKYFRGQPPDFYLGQCANWDAAQKKAGTALDEFVIFSRALTPEEIVRERDRQGAP